MPLLSRESAGGKNGHPDYIHIQSIKPRMWKHNEPPCIWTLPCSARRRRNRISMPERERNFFLQQRPSLAKYEKYWIARPPSDVAKGSCLFCSVIRYFCRRARSQEVEEEEVSCQIICVRLSFWTPRALEIIARTCGQTRKLTRPIIQPCEVLLAGEDGTQRTIRRQREVKYTHASGERVERHELPCLVYVIV